MSRSLTQQLVDALKVAAVPRALLIDDDEADAQLFCILLSALNCDSDWVNTVERGLQILQEGGVKYDIVFQDIRMPGSNRSWRDIYDLKLSIPIIIVTGYVPSNYFDSETRWGHLTVMQKPIHEAELRAVFESHNIRLPA